MHISTQNDTAKTEKFETISRLLNSDEYVLIHVNGTHTGMSLPAHLLEQSAVTLKISRLFRGSLDLSPDTVRADLLFGSSYFLCIVPLEAVWGLTSASGTNSLWPESAPKEILERISSNVVNPKASKREKKSSKLSHLRPQAKTSSSKLRRVK